MDELPEPTPEAIKKAKRYYWTSVACFAFVFMAIWTVMLFGGRHGLLNTLFGRQVDFLYRLNPAAFMMPLATLVATYACRYFKVSLETRSREHIYVNRAIPARTSNADPITVSEEKTLSIVGMVLGILLAALASLAAIIKPDNRIDFLDVAGIVSGLGAVWSFAAWRWGNWSKATLEATGVTVYKSNPWTLRKPDANRLEWSDIDQVEIGRVRGTYGDEIPGWVNFLDKRTGEWHKVPQGLIPAASWTTFRERVRATVRQDGPATVAVAPTQTAFEIPVSSEPEPVLLQRR